MALLVVSAGCGGGSDEARQDALLARRYAHQVSRISERTADELGSLSASADYRDGAAAATSTRAYAAAISEAAGQLRGITPPASVAARHRALIALYAQTSTSLEQLAARFAATRDPVELAAQAQALSSEVQRYGSSEQQLRAEIERALALTSSPAPSASG